MSKRKWEITVMKNGAEVMKYIVEACSKNSAIAKAEKELDATSAFEIVARYFGCMEQYKQAMYSTSYKDLANAVCGEYTEYDEWYDAEKAILEAGYIPRETVWGSGYIFRNLEAIVEPYSGLYGYGFVVRRPTTKSTRYHYLDYYVKRV